MIGSRSQLLLKYLLNRRLGQSLTVTHLKANQAVASKSSLVEAVGKNVRRPLATSGATPTGVPGIDGKPRAGEMPGTVPRTTTHPLAGAGGLAGSQRLQECLDQVVKATGAESGMTTRGTGDATRGRTEDGEAITVNDKGGPGPMVETAGQAKTIRRTIDVNGGILEAMMLAKRGNGPTTTEASPLEGSRTTASHGVDGVILAMVASRETPLIVDLVEGVSYYVSWITARFLDLEVARIGKGRKTHTAHVTSCGTGDYSDSEDDGEFGDGVPEEVAQAFLTYQTAKNRYKEQVKNRGYQANGKDDNGERDGKRDGGGQGRDERLKKLKSKSYCASCGRKGHWHKDPECPNHKGPGGADEKNVRGVEVCHHVPAEVMTLKHEGEALVGITDTACAKSVAGTSWLQRYSDLASKVGEKVDLVKGIDDWGAQTATYSKTMASPVKRRSEQEDTAMKIDPDKTPEEEIADLEKRLADLKKKTAAAKGYPRAPASGARTAQTTFRRDRWAPR
ncbi:unnamed protein product [Symbiodinium necroappetens]|uniref:Uncharacterized protein n=1 Tax=Symbiodinium necroappetens TaxID=1628268 RepID=A0A812TE88_9DINO|nr:unnamed protein product [Symbiodinium necroappetens]